MMGRLGKDKCADRAIAIPRNVRWYNHHKQKRSQLIEGSQAAECRGCQRAETVWWQCAVLQGLHTNSIIG